MKKISIYSILSLGIIMMSCDREEFSDLAAADYQYVGVVSQRAPSAVLEGSGTGGTTQIPLLYDINGTSDASITFTVTGTAELGTDFTVTDATSISGNTFTINLPGDTVATSFTVLATPNFEQSTSGNLSFTAEITETPAGIFAGAPLSSSITLEITDDDCDFVSSDFAGTAATEDFVGTTSNGTYTTAVSLVSGTTYSVADYAASFLGTGNPYQFTIDTTDPTALVVDVPTQTFDAFGRSWEITDLNDSEVVNTCGKSVTFTTKVRTTAPTPDEFNLNFTITYTLP